MKKVLLLIIAPAIMLGACKQSGNTKSIDAQSVQNPLTADGKIDTTNLPKFEFTTDSYDFGKIVQGEKISYSFKFKNTGKSALIISSANATCGCTVPSYPEEPIAPGEDAKIDVVFDSKGKMGIQSKTITVIANTIPNTKVLYLRGEVLEAK
jgi:hypothetical protein